jgi:hypothetical protein
MLCVKVQNAATIDDEQLKKIPMKKKMLNQKQKRGRRRR